jgi:hypothetical protein
MARKYLSKSTFIKGVQCEKALYLHKFNSELSDEISQQQEAIFQTGTNVGILAQELFPGGIDASPTDYTKYFESFKYTQQLIDEGAEVIYEAGFCFDYVMCFVDILVKKDGRWHAYEVKSSTKVSETHIIDASLQYYIMKNSGLELADISIIHIDNNYVRDGALDLDQLFHSVSVVNQAENNNDYVKNKLLDLHTTLSKDSVPNIDIGTHCSYPYDCNFKSHCWKHIPEYSIFDLSRLNKKIKWSLYNDRHIEIKDLPIDTKLSDNQKIEIESYINQTEIINESEIREFVKSLSYNIYHLDFETYQSAVPPFNGLKPYQQIPFQYSAHYENNGTIEHCEFLADPSHDSREAFVKALINDMNKEGDILVYNIGFERGRLDELIRILPKYQAQLQSIINRMKDLMIPFKEKWYYVPAMKGSFSIKYVLPALVPSLSYDNLEINNGSSASSTYANLHTLSNLDQINQTRKHLLEYCKLDTFAMVKILEVLKSV